jgi:hypothetical protein
VLVIKAKWGGRLLIIYMSEHCNLSEIMAAFLRNHGRGDSRLLQPISVLNVRLLYWFPQLDHSNDVERSYDV